MTAKKGKGGRHRYRDNNKIEAIHGLYEEPKDEDGDRGDHDENWDDMEEKERENKDDNDNIIGITAAQFFGIPDEAFLIKNNKKTEEKKGDDSDENGDGREEGQ